MNILSKFKLYGEREDAQTVHDLIARAVPFRGTNLWILIFAIIIASLGLNVNSTAVIIGAMLISPLMGPIMGIGYSLAINDLSLLKNSFFNYSIAGVVGLLASALYFLLTPIHEAQSEILARTQPTVYDVLIALAGGFAGILAACSRQKGNVIPGVAIATALMPPLCTAGYGLAMLNPHYLFGAFYLYLINSVFIALATFVTTRYLKFPYKEFLSEMERKKSQRIITLVTVLTLLPSIYFAYDIIQQNQFTQSADKFLKNEMDLENTVVLNHQIEAKDQKITVHLIGKPLSDSVRRVLTHRLNIYNIPDAKLDIKQGLSIAEKDDEETIKPNTVEVNKNVWSQTQYVLDSLQRTAEVRSQVYEELKAQYPEIRQVYMLSGNYYADSVMKDNAQLLYLEFTRKLPDEEKQKLSSWLPVRIQDSNIHVLIVP